MTRSLPWKRSKHGHEYSSPIDTSAVRPPKAKSPESPRLLSSRRTSMERFGLLKASHHSDSSDPVRSPSTSPPPEVPEERLMIPGDDAYRMVEDELLRAAQRFTAHLHRAEYERLKTLVKSKNAATIQKIERPIVGTPTMNARRRKEQGILVSKQRRMLHADDGDNNPPIMGSSLRGLLDAPREEARTLIAKHSALDEDRTLSSRQVASTRASSTRRTESRHRSSLVSDSGLKLSSLSRIRSEPQVRSVFVSNRAPGSQPAGYSSPLSRRSVTHMNVSPGIGLNGVEDDVEVDDPFGLHDRRIRRQKSREQFRTLKNKVVEKEPPPDTMPTFV